MSFLSVLSTCLASLIFVVCRLPVTLMTLSVNEQTHGFDLVLVSLYFL